MAVAACGFRVQSLGFMASPLLFMQVSYLKNPVRGCSSNLPNKVGCSTFPFFFFLGGGGGVRV